LALAGVAETFGAATTVNDRIKASVSTTDTINDNDDLELIGIAVVITARLDMWTKSSKRDE
jgi:hypothetical protein